MGCSVQVIIKSELKEEKHNASNLNSGRYLVLQASIVQVKVQC